MKVKTIKIKSLEQGFTDFKKVFEQVASGKKLPPARQETYFESLEAVRRVLTPERLKLLKYIKEQKPQSIYAVAKGLKKDLKNVSQDLKYLADIGLVQMTKKTSHRRQIQPHVVADRLLIQIEI